MSFFQELKRRNVFRVGIAYIVGAWLLAQVADLVLDVIGAPDIVLRTVVALLALGFVPTAIFAWAFEMTPEGVKKESEVDRGQSITHHTAKKLDMVTIGLLIAAIALLALNRFMPQQSEATELPAVASQAAAPVQATAKQPAETTSNTTVDEKSIAVLPFANRSNQDDDLFFTDGIHDDLLTQLAKIHDLTVISRTSVMEYRDTSKNLREIGAELGVATILEGGIQKVGERVRINAQLIEVATDKHLWAESYDRELTAENIFDLQSEIAREIVKAISVELTPEEELLLSEVPTQNLAAYEAYLRAREIYYGANYSRTREAQAQPLLERAIALDPEYTQAIALLASIYGQLFWRGLDTSDALLKQYRDTVDQALALNPRSPSALRASANYLYRIENDYRQSMTLLSRALEQAPGNVDLYGDLALSQRRLGLWQESIASFRKAVKLDPANRFYHTLMVETMAVVTDWQGVLDNTVALEDANPDDLDAQLVRALALFNLTGDLMPMQRVFETMNLEATSIYVELSARIHWLQRDADATIATLNNEIWMQSTESLTGQINRLYELANAYRLKGDELKAAEYHQAVIANRDKVLASGLQVRAFSGMTIALSMARMGRTDEALALAEQLVQDIPAERDAMLTGWLLVRQAMVKGLAGDQESAIDQLEISLEMPTGQPNSKWDLHLDPNWDFMRDNPRFRELSAPPNVIRTATP